MNWPKARIKLVQTTDGRWWCLAGWQETYNAAIGGRVFLTLQDGDELKEEVITSLEFAELWPKLPTYEFSITAGPVEEPERSRNDLNPAGRRF